MFPIVDATVVRSAFFGEGNSYLTLGTVNCHGRESGITACSYGEYPACTHAEDVGVRCLEAGELPTGTCVCFFAGWEGMEAHERGQRVKGEERGVIERCRGERGGIKGRKRGKEEGREEEELRGEGGRGEGRKKVRGRD